MTAALSLGSVGHATDAAWPTKPIRIVVASSPAGASDTLARILVEGMGKTLGQPVIVDNKPGASGLIGARDVLNAPADGYTFLMFPQSLVTELPQAMKVDYDPFKDFKPLVQVMRQGLLLLGGPSVGSAATLPELVKYVRANPGKLGFATGGVGVPTHTTAVQFARLAGLDMTMVPHKGTPPALTAVMGGHVALSFDTPLATLPLIRSGKIRVYASTYPTRPAFLPDVPTFAELGFPKMNDVSWIGIWSLSGVPQAIQDKVRNAALRALQEPKVQARLADLGADPGLPLTSEELTRDLHEAYARQGELLKSIDYKRE
ncbi:MAG: tripartite tricarboxylate transporter substrate binding protein [Burkholderiales bacterium]|nr:tripartite tricarboxylate transporter substrate binding protein [Burkholderiales bacterium]MBK8665491.1 tripartite tricarboxylate transporter substrate binding protein [Burkholderiales bacterium]